MATDFNKNAVSLAGGIKPSSLNTPTDIRCRVETEADILSIPRPYIGMLVYVIDVDKFFKVTSLKPGKVGMSTKENVLVDTYEEFNGDLVERLEALESINHDDFLKEHQDISHLAVRKDVDDLMATHEQESGEKFSNIEAQLNQFAEDTQAIDKRVADLEDINHKTLVEGLASEEFVKEQDQALKDELNEEVNKLQVELGEEVEKINTKIDEEIQKVKDESISNLDTKYEDLKSNFDQEVEDRKAADVELVEEVEKINTKIDEEIQKVKDDLNESVANLDTKCEDLKNNLNQEVEDRKAADVALKEELVDLVTGEVDKIHEEIADEVELINKDVAAQFASLEKYSISNVPEGTLVDYREKEIRIMCPKDAVFTKQNPGDGGNPNMYYMTFTTYFPEEAVTFREGDKGVLVDEYLNFEDTSGTGIDVHGRKYKHHWFALANFNGSSWNYFGKTSSVDKYIGWTYCVEYYDAQGKVIGSDCIRINLSNEDCHNNVEPYYGFRMASTSYVDGEINELAEKVDGEINELAERVEVLENLNLESKPYIDKDGMLVLCGCPAVIRPNTGRVLAPEANETDVVVSIRFFNDELDKFVFTAEQFAKTRICMGYGAEGVGVKRNIVETTLELYDLDKVFIIDGGSQVTGEIGTINVIAERCNYIDSIQGARAMNGGERNIVHNFNVRVTDCKVIDTLFGGGNGYSVVWNSDIEVNGDTEINYLVAGGSNGYTRKSHVVVNDGKIKVLQGVNRGILDRAELILNGGEVEKFYAAGDIEDSSVDGAQFESYVELNAGVIHKFFKGNSNLVEFNNITGSITDCIVHEGDISMLVRIEHEVVIPPANVSGYPTMASALNVYVEEIDASETVAEVKITETLEDIKALAEAKGFVQTTILFNLINSQNTTDIQMVYGGEAIGDLIPIIEGQSYYKINMLAVMVEDELHIDIEINTSSRLVVIYSE